MITVKFARKENDMLKAKTTRKVYDNTGNEWEVHGWYLTQHGWEYWQLEPTDQYGCAMCYVQGMACEFGTVNLQHISKYVISSTEGLGLWDLSPPYDGDMKPWAWSENQGFG
jgi:hypothetical protein